MKTEDSFLHSTLEWNQVNIPRFIGLGLIFTIAEQVVLYPLDVIRTRLQVETSRIGPFKAAKLCFQNTLKGEGLPGFYRGFWWQTVPNSPSNVLYLGTYSAAKEYGLKVTQHWDPVVRSVCVPMVAGGLADLACSVFYNPVDVVVQRLQLQRRPKGTTLPLPVAPKVVPLPASAILAAGVTEKLGAQKDLPHVRRNPSTTMEVPRPPTLGRLPEGTGEGGVAIIRTMLKDEGWRGFYRGLLAGTLYHLPSSALWWPAYEISKSALLSLFTPPPTQKKKSPLLPPPPPSLYSIDHFLHPIAGMTAAVITTTINNPLNITKTRIQTRTESYGTTNPLRVLYRIIKYEGFMALSRGVVPRLLYNVPNSAIAAFTYELLLKLSQEGRR